MIDEVYPVDLVKILNTELKTLRAMPNELDYVGYNII